jgi:MFS transporter, PAT family, beta-lactamase induction signal transducer AmpG
VNESSPTARRSWLADLRVYLEPGVLRMLLLGFSAGLPLLLVLGTLSFRLREAGIDRTTIGFLSWIALAYAFKWVWAPFVDRVPLPGLTRLLGRRRSWLLLAQAGIVAGLIGSAMTDPLIDLHRLVFFTLLIAFSSATQDIALDAFRIESAGISRQAAMAATYQIGYRGAMIFSSAGALWIAAMFDPNEKTYEHAPWMTAYMVMAMAMSVGVLTVLFSKEPTPPAEPAVTEGEKTFARQLHTVLWLPAFLSRFASWFYRVMLSPFLDFISRYGWQALLILGLIGTYRISDIVMGVMASPFYRDMGYTKDEVAAISGVYGVIMTLVGASLGGVLSLRFGVMRILFGGAALSAGTNLIFAWLATRGHDLPGLIMAISIDNLSAGIASAAFVAYLSSLTNVAYSATQYALFSSVMLLLPKFLAGFSGWVVDHSSYETFFTSTALMGIPVLILVVLAGRVQRIPNSAK